MMSSQFWKWVLGLSYIVAVASIWIAASFVVQSVVDDGVSPFLITYICNSLFVIYVPLFEIVRYLEDAYGSLWFWRKKNSSLTESADSEAVVLLGKSESSVKNDNVDLDSMEDVEISEAVSTELDQSSLVHSVTGENGDTQLDAKSRWSRVRMAKVSLLICPFWFLAQLTFNLSLKYTSVTSNTILSSSSSLFTFLVALVFLGESFTWLKLVSVLLCMLGTIIVSVGDSDTGLKETASNPLLGDILALVSSGFYAVYITLIRKKLPDEDGNDGRASMIQFLGYLGFFNLLIFLPVALILNFTKLEPFSTLTWKQFGLVVGKGLLDNVLSDYLWAKAVLLTSTTVATAGLTIQVPLAAIVDSVMGNIPSLLDFVGAAAILVGFAGINIPRDAFCKPKGANLENGNLRSTDEGHVCRVTEDADQLPDTYSANYSKLSLSTMSCKFRVCRNEDTHTKKVMAVESSCSAAIAYSGSESWEVLLNHFYKLKAPTTIPFMQKCSVGYLYQNNLNPVQLIFFQSVEEKVSCAANILSEC